MAYDAPKLSTDRLILRVASEADVPAVVRYYVANAPHLAPSHPSWPEGFFTEEFWLVQVRRDADEFREGSALRLTIFEKHRESDVVGALRFSGITRGPLQACYLGYHLAEDKQGRGMMTEALRAAIPFAFGPLGVHRIMA